LAGVLLKDAIERRFGIEATIVGNGNDGV